MEETKIPPHGCAVCRYARARALPANGGENLRDCAIGAPMDKG
jgi:hypothetical protein